MALNTFGWTPAEVTTDSAGNVVAGVTLTVFTDVTKATQVTSLFDKDGVTPLANNVVVSDNKGRFGFKASDTYSLLYVYDGSTADPWPIAAHEALDAGMASHAQAVADAQAAADSAAASAALVGAPADTAIAAAVNGAGSATTAALKAGYAGVVTRRAGMSMSVGGSNTSNSQSSVNQRYFVRPTTTATRWRIKLANYDTKNNVTGNALAGASIYYGRHTLAASGEGTGVFTTAPTQLVSSAFTIPGDGTQYVSPWFDAATAPLESGKDYLISVGFSNGVAVPIFRGYGASAIGFGGAAGATHAGDTTNASASVFTFSFLDAVLEFEVKAHRPTSGVFIGDSLTECFGGDATLGMNPWQRWPDNVGVATAGAATVSAIAGSTTANWLSTSQLCWSRLDLATYAPDYAVLALGSNDAAASVTLATYQANVGTLVGTLRGYGVRRIYLATVMPRGLAAGPEAIRVSYNGWLRTLPLGVTGVFDFDRVVRDPAAPAALHADFAYTDAVHLNRAGYAALAQAVRVPVRMPL